MKMLLGVFGVVLLLVLIIGGSVWWRFYKYGDCLNVGHSRMYCILDNGN